MFVETKFFHKAGEGSGGGGSDPHNLGYYADLTALQTARPTGTDGDFAILGSTDTIWVWDSGTSAWKDTDTKGQVTSVNNQTGAVTLTASDVGAATSAQGAKADTAIQPGDLATVATTGAYSDLTGKPTIPAAIQVSTMPTAAVGELDKIYQFIGTTDANYTNGCFYKCMTNAGSTNYWWTIVYPINNFVNVANKLLLGIGATLDNSDYHIAIGPYAAATGYYSTAVGNGARSSDSSTALGSTSKASGSSSIAIGSDAIASANECCQIGLGTNATIRTLQFRSFQLLSADGTIPSDRFTTTPSADGTYVPTLTISSGTATRTWGAAASAPVVPATAPTLAVADWSSNTQTITVSGVTSSNVVLVGPAPSSAQDYADAGILCTAQGTDSLTFTASTTPTNAITLSVVIFG